MREEIKELKKILMELNNQETTRLQISGTDWEEEEGNGNLNISYDQRSKMEMKKKRTRLMAWFMTLPLLLKSTIFSMLKIIDLFHKIIQTPVLGNTKKDNSFKT